ncbi:MAG: primosomal protein N' [Dehalococcoidales bacterium]|jgi:primosomal protein N' (replication factor Y)|nr:primosomal protein N' [Dehalococcoidales bacterium]MDP6576863.1 primosomal protein N' [Dehalococcoidales bacterium]
MKYAEVSVNSPVAQYRAFSYAIPSGLNIQTGQAVWVPFGDKTLQGIVLELSPYPTVEETREIINIIDPRPLLSPAQVMLAREISEYYLSSLFDAIALMLPPGFERKPLTFISPASNHDAGDLSSFSPDSRQTLELVRQQGKVSLKELEKRLGRKKVRIIVSQLVGRGLVVRSYELEPVKISPQKVLYLRLNIAADNTRTTADSLRRKRAVKQAVLLDFLARQSGSVSWAKARQETGVDKAVAKALARQGLTTFRQIEIRREPISYRDITLSSPLKLTTAQESAFGAVRDVIRDDRAHPRVFLLHGVTGSGKTEIYLQALAETVKQGQRGIILVPEISLTPQTIERFASRFPHRVAVQHSKLSPGEQFDEWYRIRSGEFDVVIGPRSALFTPQPNLGLIVIDEEHEWTYKQTDKSPRYHARDTALKLAELTGAVVILGSATPDVETFYHAERGAYRLLQLPERVVPDEGASLPQVETVDLRNELKAGNRSIFSRSLSRAVTRAVASGEQVILFLNRRGGTTFVQCRHCGFVLRCPRCEVTLTHHLAEDALVCHQCHRKTPILETCPRCLGRQIKFLGLGTQKLEQETRAAFPRAQLLRWDSDVTRHKNAHEEILGKFRAHQADILIGTQMVAKGLDLPSVTLVGVVIADTSLNLPDFRAGERTFQLLSQVAGRAGRGALGGQVIIQTYSPEHYAVQAAAQHDYASFYTREITYRRQLGNPPFTRLAQMTYSHANDALCQREAEKIRDLLAAKRDAKEIDNLDLIGPAPAFIHRLRGRFRWQLILRGTRLSAFLSQVPLSRGWTVDIDPVSLL